MTAMNPRLDIEVVWTDEHAVEVELRAANERFSGVTRFYTAHSEIAEFGKELSGFPTGLGDVREFEFGSVDAESRQEGAKLRFCLSASGHARVDVELFSAEAPPGCKETASFSIPTEAAAIDRFVKSLLELRTEVGALASLPMGG